MSFWLDVCYTKKASFDGGLLGCLACIHTQEVQGSYSMPEDLINRWKKLEFLICSAITTLGAKYKIPAIGPPIPGYWRQHAYQSVAYWEAWASCDVFVLWIGALSYLVAGADTAPENDWLSFLQNELSFYPAMYCWSNLYIWLWYILMWSPVSWCLYTPPSKTSWIPTSHLSAGLSHTIYQSGINGTSMK